MQRIGDVRLPVTQAVLRRRLRAWRDLGHSFDCAVAFARRPARSTDPLRCLCRPERRQDDRSTRAVA